MIAASVSDISYMFKTERRQAGKKAKAPNQLLCLLLPEKQMLFQDCPLSRFCLHLLAVPGPHDHLSYKRDWEEGQDCHDQLRAVMIHCLELTLYFFFFN